MNQTPSDRELAQLFAQTRAQLADRARREVNRVNTDLDQMLTKIRQAQAADEHYQSLSRTDRYPFTYTSLTNASDTILNDDANIETAARAEGESISAETLAETKIRSKVAESANHLAAITESDADSNPKVVEPLDPEPETPESETTLEKSTGKTTVNEEKNRQNHRDRVSNRDVQAETVQGHLNTTLTSMPRSALSTGAISGSELATWGIEVSEYPGLNPLPQLDISKDGENKGKESQAEIQVDKSAKYTLASIAALFPVQDELVKKPLQIFISPAQLSDDALMVLRHLVKRTQAKLVLGGVKALLPGEEPRVRNSDELNKLVEESDESVYLLVVDSPVPAHQRTLSKIMQDLENVEAVALVDAETPELPESLGISITQIIALNLWENPKLSAFLRLPPAVLLDTAPASVWQWELILEYQLRKLSTYR